MTLSADIHVIEVPIITWDLWKGTGRNEAHNTRLGLAVATALFRHQSMGQKKELRKKKGKGRHVFFIGKKSGQSEHREYPSKLWEVVDEEWEKTSKELCRNLFASMPDRLQAVIKAKGGYTKY